VTRDKAITTPFVPAPGESKGKLTQWMKRYVPKEQQSSVETLVTSIKEEHESLNAGERRIGG